MPGPVCLDPCREGLAGLPLGRPEGLVSLSQHLLSLPLLSAACRRPPGGGGALHPGPPAAGLARDRVPRCGTSFRAEMGALQAPDGWSSKCFLAGSAAPPCLLPGALRSGARTVREASFPRLMSGSIPPRGPRPSCCRRDGRTGVPAEACALVVAGWSLLGSGGGGSAPASRLRARADRPVRLCTWGHARPPAPGTVPGAPCGLCFGTGGHTGTVERGDTEPCGRRRHSAGAWSAPGYH